jgi:hypothetical protein
MALRTSTRTEGGSVAEYTDQMFRCVMKDTRMFDANGAVVSGSIQVWGEWHIDLGDGRFHTRAARCDLSVEEAILALPNLGTALDQCAANTHPKVTP